MGRFLQRGPGCRVPENQLEAALDRIKKRFAFGKKILDAKISSPIDKNPRWPRFFFKNLAMKTPSSAARKQYVLLQKMGFKQ